MSDAREDRGDEPNTLVNAVLGGIASILLAFLPLSTVLGGALAGYLQGPDRGAGARVGAYAGVVAAIPLVLITVFGLSVLATLPVGGMGPRGGLAFGLGGFLFVLFAVLFIGIYGIGLSALGGYLGAYVNGEL